MIFTQVLDYMHIYAALLVTHLSPFHQVDMPVPEKEIDVGKELQRLEKQLNQAGFCSLDILSMRTVTAIRVGTIVVWRCPLCLKAQRRRSHHSSWCPCCLLFASCFLPSTHLGEILMLKKTQNTESPQTMSHSTI